MRVGEEWIRRHSPALQQDLDCPLQKSLAPQRPCQPLPPRPFRKYPKLFAPPHVLSMNSSAYRLQKVAGNIETLASEMGLPITICVYQQLAAQRKQRSLI